MTGYIRVSVSWMKTVLLVGIAVLFALNLLLPVRYTLQLVPVTTPPEQAILAERRSELAETVLKETASVLKAERRETLNNLSDTLSMANEAKQRETDSFASFLRRTLNDNKNDNNDKVPEEKNKLDPRLDPHSKDSRRPRLTEYKRETGGRERDDYFRQRGGGYGGDPDVPLPHRVNFHDPIQRLAYYRKLRQRMGGADSRIRLNRRQSVNRKEMIRDIWGGWFENDEDCKL